ncbi:hypothetical protein GCM10022423_44030 [Flavobacterium ginsengiterrae]|uniref:Uncharacterized protein n=1 Tax=Flavobacterium ginsengiterrae TaxID=871695 RepID=A0ABP7H604_9FLAO
MFISRGLYSNIGNMSGNDKTEILIGVRIYSTFFSIAENKITYLIENQNNNQTYN